MNELTDTEMQQAVDGDWIGLSDNEKSDKRKDLSGEERVRCLDMKREKSENNNLYAYSRDIAKFQWSIY